MTVEHVCGHVPRCLRLEPGYCWPPDYVRDVAIAMRSQALDPVQLCQRTGKLGLAARIREHLDATLPS